MKAVDPTSDPLGWLRDVRATFGTMLRHCGAAEAERYFRACEPEAAKAMAALPPRSVGLVADLQAECLAALDQRAPLGDPFPAAPVPADDTRPAYPLEGKRLVLEDWLARWEELAATHPADALPQLWHDPATCEARRQIRSDTKYDKAVLTRLVEAADVAAKRTEGAAGKSKKSTRR